MVVGGLEQERGGGGYYSFLRNKFPRNLYVFFAIVTTLRSFRQMLYKHLSLANIYFR